MKHNIFKTSALCIAMILTALITVVQAASAKSENYEAATEICTEAESETDSYIKKSPFFHNSSETLTLYQNDIQYILYLTEINIDFNNDEKCTAYEARDLLRISAGLNKYDGDIAAVDIDADGRIAAADARLALRYSAKLDIYYTNADMTAPIGFLTDSDNNTYYMEQNGVISTGLKNIDGSFYYFDNDKKMVTGLHIVYGSNYYFDASGKGTGGKYTINGTEYLFDNSGKSYSGEYTENGKQYYYENGIKHTGWYKNGDTYRYYNADGTMATGEVTVNGTEYRFAQNGTLYQGTYSENGKTYYYVNGIKYTGWYKNGNTYRYYNTDGSMATGKTTIDGTVYNFGTDGTMSNGFITSQGKTYYYQNGVMCTGKQTINGNIYYFYNDGHMAKGTTVNGITYNDNGIAVKAAKSFFDDAVFIGDSVSVKLASYQKSTAALGKAQFFAASSLSAANALWEVSSKSVHPKYNGQKTLVENCVKYSGAKKVFIMLGMNDIGIYSFDKSINNYKELISRIKEKSPNVDIYIQSMTPMTSISTRADEKLNNTNIKLYNKRLKQMCSEMGWHYLDVASALYDSTGTYLPQEYCSDPVYMGLHMSDKGCEKWVEYLLNNAAFV